MSTDSELVSGPPATEKDSSSYAYDCFISYTHHDRRVAASVQKGLTHIGRRLGRLNALRVFRDATDLTASPNLWGAVTDSMDRARFLVVVLSPEAAASRWVDREVAHWLEHRGSERVMLVVAAGSLVWDEVSLRFDPAKSNAAVPVLTRPGAFAAEPFYVEVSDDAPWDPKAPLFREKVTDLAAPIHGKPKYLLASEDLREQRRFRRLRLAAIVTLVLLTIGALAASGVAIEQRREAVEQRQEAIRQRNEAASLALSAQSREVAENNGALALALASESAGIMPLWQSASALIDSRVVVAESAAQQLREPLRGHNGTVYSVSFGPDGDVVASSASDGSVRLWDSSNGKPVGEPLAGHEGNVWQVVFSPDGRWLVSVDSDDVRVWDAEGLEPIGAPIEVPDSMWNAITFRPRSSVIALANDSSVQLLDLANGSARQFASGQEVLTDLAFSPDGRHLATVEGWRLDPSRPQGPGVGGSLQLWDLQRGEAPVSLAREGEDFTAAAFSPDGRILVSASHQGSVGMWDAVTGTRLGSPLNGHTGHLYAVAFSPRGDLVASAGDDGTVRLWDPISREQVGDPINHPGAVRSLSFSPDGSTLVTGSEDGAVRLWSVVKPAPIVKKLDGRGGAVAAVAFSADGGVLASGGEDGVIRLWDPVTGRAVGDPLLGHSGFVTDLAVSPVDGVLVSGSDDGSVRFWDVATGKQARDPLTGFDWIFDVALSRDGSQVAVSEGWASILDYRTGKQIGQAFGDEVDGFVNSMAFSPVGNLLAAGQSGNTVTLWDAAKGREARPPLAGHTGSVTAVAFSPAGDLLASGSKDGTIRLWNPATGEPVGEPLNGHLGEVTAVAFSPDGRLLASGGDDALVQLWDPVAGKALGEPLRGHTDTVATVAFSLRGNLLASGGDDGTVLVWEPLWDADEACRLARPYVTASQVRSFLPSGLRPTCRFS